MDEKNAMLSRDCNSIKHEGALYNEVFPGKTKVHLSVTVDERGSNSAYVVTRDITCGVIIAARIGQRPILCSYLGLEVICLLVVPRPHCVERPGATA